MNITIHKGLDLPIGGQPQQSVDAAKPVHHVAVLGVDYPDLKPSMLVNEGDHVKLGQPLFSHKKLEGVHFTAPAAGRIKVIHRGARRILHSVVIECDQAHGLDDEPAETFTHCTPSELATLDATTVRDNLLRSGLWTAFKTRPYGKIPAPESTPAAIFVTAIDTRPLAADPTVVLAGQEDAFAYGLEVLAKLTPGTLWLCQKPNAAITLPQSPIQLKTACFDGPHPAGLPGTHIHFLDPVHADKTVWHIDYQEVIAIGRLFTQGRLDVTRVIALAGPQTKRPRLLRTRLGACIDELVADELQTDANCRIISGSVLDGRTAQDWSAYLGRFHYQIATLPNPQTRQLFGWIRPGGGKFSKINVMLSSLFRARGEALPLSTAQNGSFRAMMPIGNFEEVMPLDILPTQLLRYLLVGDTDMAQKLGCLELDEEDLALCSFVCIGKHSYGPMLRESLRKIEREG